MVILSTSCVGFAPQPSSQAGWYSGVGRAKADLQSQADRGVPPSSPTYHCIQIMVRGVDNLVGFYIKNQCGIFPSPTIKGGNHDLSDHCIYLQSQETHLVYRSHLLCVCCTNTLTCNITDTRPHRHMGGSKHKVFRSAKKSLEVKSNCPEMDKRERGKAGSAMITTEKERDSY